MVHHGYYKNKQHTTIIYPMSDQAAAVILLYGCIVYPMSDQAAAVILLYGCLVYLHQTRQLLLYCSMVA